MKLQIPNHELMEKYQEVLLVGINYYEKKHHECLIEKI